MGISSFTSSFIKDAMLKDVWHVVARISDVQVAFGILIHYFMQRPSYILQCRLPFSTFTKSFIAFDSSFLQVFGCFLGPRSFNNFKGPLAWKQAYFPITFSGIRFILMTTITLTTYLGSWAFVASITTIRFIIDEHFVLFKTLAQVNNFLPFLATFRGGMWSLIALSSCMSSFIWITHWAINGSTSRLHLGVSAPSSPFQHVFWRDV